jgi:hypothetical protein
MEVLIYNNHIYYIKKYFNETNNMFWERAWFIAKNSYILKDTESSLIINYSKLWQYNKFYNCIYSTNIMEKIKELENNLY